MKLLSGRKLSQIIACISICIGLIVCIGWLLDIPILKSIIPNAVTMKFSTSISFIFSGIAIYFLSKYTEGKTNIAKIVIPISSLVVFLFMTTLLTAYIFGKTSGIEQLFIKESSDAIKTSLPGMPSFATIVNFILIIVGIFAFFESRLKKLFTPIGYAISTIGIISIIGYGVNQPILYYYIDNVSTAMAIHTSFLFTSLGIALILSRNNITVQHGESVKIYTKILSLFLASSVIPIIFVIGLNFNILESVPNNESIKISMIIISISTIITVIIFSSITARSISKPIISLKNVAMQISKGNFSIKANESGSDEISELSKTFNDMIGNIKMKEVLHMEIEKLKHVNEEQRQYELETELKKISDLKKALDESSIVDITDKEGTIIDVNKKFEKISKYTRNQLLGQNHRILKSGFHTPEFYEDMWNTITQGKVWQRDVKNRARDGTYYWVKTTIVPFLGKDGKPEQYIAIRTDITNQKLLERRLESLLENLKTIDMEKEEFAAMVSHELKTPLIPISGYAELFLDGSLGNITKIQREKIHVMYENSILLTTLIQDILDAQKIELKRLNLDIRTESIKEITKRCIDIFSPIAEQKGIKIVDETQDMMISGDPDRILQVLNNIISNAIKFVPIQYGTITINSRNDNDAVMISVKDNGIGIPKSKQKDLFKKFYQIDKSLTRKSGGTGLGLAISRGIIEAHGGEIWVESKENYWTTVNFTIQKGNSK